MDEDVFQRIPDLRVSGINIGSNAERELRKCPCCAGRILMIETFDQGCTPRSRPVFTVDSS